MGYRILYLYKEENAFYIEKRTHALAFSEKELHDGVKIFSCALPEYYAKQKRWLGFRTGSKNIIVPWNFGQLLRLMQNCCERVSADACYLEENFEKELAAGGFGFLCGRQRMCGELITKTAAGLRGIDSILYLWEETQEREEELHLPEALLRKLHYFFYMRTDSVNTAEKHHEQKAEEDIFCPILEKRHTILEENLWQEYGMPLLPIEKMEELALCKRGSLLVLDDRQEGDAAYEALPQGCVYLDLWSAPVRRAQIMENRADIKYVSEYLYLLQNLDI